MSAAQRNLEHVLVNDCSDPDCELHNPEVIESDAERYTAKAWFLAGALTLNQLMDDVEGDEDNPVPSTEEIQARALLELREKHGLSFNWP